MLVLPSAGWALGSFTTAAAAGVCAEFRSHAPIAILAVLAATCQPFSSTTTLRSSTKGAKIEVLFCVHLHAVPSKYFFVCNQPTNMMQLPQEMMTHIAGFMADDLQATDPACYRGARSLQATLAWLCGAKPSRPMYVPLR